MHESVMGQPLRRMCGVLGILLLAGASAGCAGEPSHDGPFAAEFAQAREYARSDFQREVLADDVITDEEFREVRQRYIDCVTDAGMHAIANLRGDYEFSPAPTGDQIAEELRCSDETIRGVESLYSLVKVNPMNEDFSELTATCLRQQGVVESEFTGQDWDRFVNVFAAAYNAEATASPSDLPTLPGGVRMDDPRVQQCSTNPLDR